MVGDQVSFGLYPLEGEGALNGWTDAVTDDIGLLGVGRSSCL